MMNERISIELIEVVGRKRERILWLSDFGNFQEDFENDLISR
jgi:hypothetical protein